MNTKASGTALQKYSAALYCTLLYLWYIWFVIYSQNKMVWDIMTSNVNCIDIVSVS